MKEIKRQSVKETALWIDHSILNLATGFKDLHFYKNRSN
jgi:hypothetical protein